MSLGIHKRDYLEGGVEEMAEKLSAAAAEAVENDEYDDHRNAALELSIDVLDGHRWFARPDYGAADHGAIIEYASDEGVDPTAYRDLAHLVDGADPEAAVKHLAYAMFEAHVVDVAKEMPHDDTTP